MTSLKPQPGTVRPNAAGAKTRTGRLLLLVACGFAAHLASASEIFHDPTRPPSALYVPNDSTFIQVGPVLQSIRMANGRYTAVINGENVSVGSKIGEARVVKIRETEVVLKTADSLQTLKLFPEVEKRPAAIDKRIKR